MSKIYPKAKEKMMSGTINIPTDTIKVALIDTGAYTYSDAHEFYSSVAGVVGTPQTLGSKTVTDGVLNGGSVTYTAVTGNSVEAIIIYKDTGTAGTSPVIAYIDTASAGLPVTPNGGNITINWDTGVNKIFAL
jgi:hypothetical protein